MNLFYSLALFFVAIILHEFAHAWTANRLGDQTAQRSGRLTLNPLAHIDPFGTLLLPLMLLAMNAPVLFGWAKPVPVNFSNLHNPKKDIIWVGLAGPLANLAAAAVTALLLQHVLPPQKEIPVLALNFMTINVVLAVFNLFPIPPLDGSRVVVGLLPNRWALAYLRFEPYGFLLLFALLYGGLLDRILWPIAFFILRFLLSL